MTTNQFKILFVQAKNRTNKKNQSPLYCRITLNGTRKQFSTGIQIEYEYWENKKQQIINLHESAKLYNTQLSSIKLKINKIYTILSLQESNFTVDDILNIYSGKEIRKKESFLSYYTKYLSKLKKLIGTEIKENTFNKFVYVSNHIEAFLKWKYKNTNFPLDELNLQFLDDFDYYLKTEKKQSQITINKTIQRLRTPLKQAISEGYLERDPFILHKTKTVRKSIIFLNTKELKTFETTHFSQIRLSFIQDLFIFCCYTGLAFNEMSLLEKKHIQKGFDGMNWIQMKREKTQRQISVPLLPKAQEIIDKYDTEDKYLFPKISNQKFNSYIKEIAEIIGIEKRLTHHVARKTFASTVLLYNDVPMEIVSELLGHSNMTITQESYGKVVQKKVSEVMFDLIKKINTN